MWSLYSLCLLICAFSLQAQGGAKKRTLTIDLVSSQIEDYLQSAQDASKYTGPRFSNSALPSGCALACSFLAYIQPGQVSYPNDTVYVEESKYWSIQQASALPICRFSPQSPLGVSLAVLTVRVTKCHFAVKSGGHAAFTGASNINGGLTIDLVNLNQITLSADRKEVAVGPGNLWIDVYDALQPKGLSVIGGRVSDIGVGGFTTGGGMSFFSGRYGWACDNVNTYEVVFADGSIKNVTHFTYPDLYYALRGGGNNFGIVTRFDLVTFPQGDLWAGSETYIYSNDTSVSLINALYWLNINSPGDEYAQAILAYAYERSIGTYLIVTDLQYGKPIENPFILRNFTSTRGAISDTLRITNLTGLTAEFQSVNPKGFRQTFWTLTTKNSPGLLSQIVSIWMEEANKVKDAANIIPSINFQAYPTNLISHFSQNGGNAVGITTADGPLVVLNLAFSWSSTADDTRIMEAARATIRRANRTAHDQGLDHPFLYQNYAAREQPVFQSYGPESRRKLRAASRKYDPEGVWQKLQPGYFKVF
ncbi:hypothetical protein LZ554_005534 [Drepanopeziza brunnea f. sp. 'monogermtubi']|nr:hypothetical protein LZ554_005534 [Drepanopeziza brunnea f. sp. 'monogermtubi']